MQIMHFDMSSGRNHAFTALRPSLYAVAYHMLANPADAEDMVQETFLRWEETDQSKVIAPKAFLTTIITRLCLKHLQSVRVQREEPLASGVPEDLQAAPADAPDAPAQLADALSEALLVVLKALSPQERAVFLLREVFDCEYSEIAGIVHKSEENCRQILRRARERVDSRKPRFEVMPRQEDHIAKRFLQVAASGKWSDLIEILSDDATLVCDGSDLGKGPVSVSGVRAVAELVLQRASHWLGEGATVQVLRFKNRPAIFACRNGLPVSSIFLSSKDGEIQSMHVITCPVRLRSFLILN
jgi:RNA polymerase sigma-70 factor (ECF subfamily)